MPLNSNPSPNIIVEKWLDYEPQKRRVRYIPPDNSKIKKFKEPKNILIEWELPEAKEVKKTYTDLECEEVDPYEYAQKYGLDMAPMSHNQEIELVGDLDALKLIDIDKMNIKKKAEGENIKYIHSF